MVTRLIHNSGVVYLFFVVFILIFRGCLSACSGSTCASCISSSYSCSWCTQKDFREARCDSKDNLINAGCQPDKIDSPEGFLRIVQNNAVRDGTNINPKAIQVQPQHVKIKARPREDHSLSMTFRAANNFPVDLYFLFDNSISMRETISSLEKLAYDIGQAVGDISLNYQMGYGIFQDKVILPFTDTTPEKLLNPCVGKRLAGVQCAPPFEFRHLLSMTSNLTRFKNQIRDTVLSGNVDHPEGSLDALMQAVTCKALLGWREDSRKLLIFASNGPFKTAGAGKLAGIVTPNDGFCHLDVKGEYDMQLEQDYPSVSQLTETVDTHQTHIIFAVTNDQRVMFEKLSKRIPHSVVELIAGAQNTNTQNIKDIIENKYRDMLSEVEIIHNNVTGVDIQIRAISDECQSLGTNKCKGLKIGSEIKFSIDIKVTECPEKPEDRLKKVILHPNALKKDRLMLEIEVICDCDCKTDPTKWEVDSHICSNGNGTLKCGICDCNEDRFGQYCQCDSSDIDSSSSNCISPDSNSTLCSGSGICKCGICDCEDGFSGTYCQCNDRACGSYQREVCGGVRGRCVCGNCVCEEGYSGNACECPLSNRTCIQDGVICNGVGTCVCGKCQCDKKHTGMFCQNCFLCGDDPCDVESYRACAQCAHNVNAGTSDCSSLECPEVKLVNSLEDIDSSVCSIKQSDGCFLQFTTEASESNITIYVQRTKTCPQPVDIVPIIAGVIGGVVAIGILLLILWKILTSLFDKIEYSKFQEELRNCKWAQQDNPFYKPSTTTYKNPMMDTSEPID